MNELVSVDKASLDALTETLRNLSRRVAKLEAENAELRALLAQQRVHTQDEATEPEDGGADVR